MVSWVGSFCSLLYFDLVKVSFKIDVVILPLARACTTVLPKLLSHMYPILQEHKVCALGALTSITWGVIGFNYRCLISCRLFPPTLHCPHQNTGATHYTLFYTQS